MAVAVEQVEHSHALLEDASWHPWHRGPVLGTAEPTICLIALRDGKRAGHWIVPIARSGGVARATSSRRLLPYASPYIADEHPRRRRETISQLLIALQQRVASIELPLEPGFSDLGALHQAGAFCEARSTHIVRRANPGWFLSGAAANHARSATAKIAVSKHRGTNRFNFSKAIRHQTPAVVAARKALAQRLADRVMVMDATVGETLIGQQLVVFSAGQALFMHAWFDRPAAPRGAPTLLIKRAVEESFQQGCEVVDLEGSIISTVDEFMDGLGAETITYPRLFWALSRRSLFKSLGESWGIEGRSRREVT